MSRRQPRGFTLVEVLVATALLAGGLAIAFAAVTASMKTAQRGQAESRRTEDMRGVSAFVRSAVSSARPATFGRDAATGLPTRFVGTASEMQFVANLPPYLGIGGPQLHRLQAIDTPRGIELRVDFAPVLHADGAVPQWSGVTEVLATGLQDVRFSYRTIDEAGKPAAWREHWDREEHLPAQVRIEMVDTSTPWPPLVFTLPLAGKQP